MKENLNLFPSAFSHLSYQKVPQTAAWQMLPSATDGNQHVAHFIKKKENHQFQP
jgi:hypothetical protein